ASAVDCVVSAVCADSVYVVFLIGTLRACAASIVVDRCLGSRIDEPSRDGATEDDRPTAIGSRGGLGKAGFFYARLYARSNHTPAGGVDAWRMCATHRTLHCSCRRDLSWEKSRA